MLSAEPGALAGRRVRRRLAPWSLLPAVPSVAAAPVRCVCCCSDWL